MVSTGVKGHLTMRNRTLALLVAAIVVVTVVQCATPAFYRVNIPLDHRELVLARPAAIATPGLSLDLALTATSLALQIQATRPPQPPKTGGGGAALATGMPVALPRTGHAKPGRKPVIVVVPRRPVLSDAVPEFTVEAKWPKQLLLSQSHIISLILRRDPDKVHATVVGTDDRLGLVSDRVLLPAGTPDADVDIAFGADRRLFVEADLVATDFEVAPPRGDVHRVLSGQDSEEWSWVITPRTAGPRRPVARLRLGWEEIAPAARAFAAPTSDYTIPMAMTVAADASPWRRWWPTLLGLALALGGGGFGLARWRLESRAIERFRTAHGQDLERVRANLAGTVGEGKTTDRLVASLGALAYRHRDALAKGDLSSEQLGALLAHELGTDDASAGALLTLRGADVDGNVSVGDVAGGDVIHIGTLQVVLPPEKPTSTDR